MAEIDKTPPQAETGEQPSGNMIGGPLSACAEAQDAAAKASWDFIQNVGFDADSQTERKKTVNVSFQFMKDGRMAQLDVPMLSLVPVPYIAIQTIDTNFKANIHASPSGTNGQAESTPLNPGLFRANPDFHANYASKKDPKDAQDSKYSVDYAMDVAVKAGEESMPVGLAKVLELLGTTDTDQKKPK